MGQSIVITSGKGGTGKTSLTGGLSSCLAALGQRVLCIDGDIGLRNLDLTLGMSDQILMDYADVIDGRCTLEEAVVEHDKIKNLFLLTAPVSIHPDEIDKISMVNLIESAKQVFDFVLVDSPAGLGSGFELAICGADQAIIVVNSDPASLRDAQRISCILEPRIPLQRLVVNRVQPKLLKKMSSTIDDAMDTVGLGLLGLIPEDQNVPLSSTRNTPIIMMSKRGAPMAYYRISKRLLGNQISLKSIR